MEDFSVSVVIPTMGARSSYINEALRSVEEQRHHPDQIVVVHNGLGIADFARQHAQQTSVPMTIIRAPYRCGAGQARNIGASVSSSSYVCFLDDDDLWHPSYVTEVLRIVESDGPDCVVSRLDKHVDGSVRSYKNPTGKLDPSILLTKNPGASGSSTTVRRDAFLESGGYDTCLITGEDKSLVLDMILKGYVVVAAPRAGAILRDHQGERLRDDANTHLGLVRFIDKYRRIMTSEQLVCNLERLIAVKSRMKSRTLRIRTQYWNARLRILARKPAEIVRLGSVKR